MKYDHYESGQLYGIRYTFREGERLWPHEHVGDMADQAHNIIVLKGTVLFDGLERRILTAGEVFDFDGAQLHSIRALEDSITLHFLLSGKPATFADYTDAQKHGEA